MHWSGARVLTSEIDISISVPSVGRIDFKIVGYTMK